MAANDDLLDAQLAHATYTQRFGTGLAKRVLKLLEEAEKDLKEQVAGRLATMTERGYDPGPVTTARLEALFETVATTRAAGYVALQSSAVSELIEFAAHEIDFQKRLLERVLPFPREVFTPPRQLIASIVTARPMQGRVLRQWMGDLEAAERTAIRSALNIGMAEGESIPNIVKRIGDRVDLSRRQVTAIVQTATNYVSNQARDAVAKENADLVKKMQWHATLDGKTCQECGGLDGKLFPVESGRRPPAHISCLPGDSLVTPCGDIAGVSKRWFDGEVVIVKTAGGRELTCTPNHPIFTRDGWVAAEKLDVVGNVACCLPEHRATSGFDVDHQYAPASIQEIVDSFLDFGQMVTVPVPTTRADFHGDGIEGEIAVVGTNCLLMDRVNSQFSQQAEDFEFKRRSATEGFFKRLRAPAFRFKRILSAARRSIGRCRELLDFLLGGSVHSRLLLLGAGSGGDSMRAQNAEHGLSADVEFSGDALGPDALSVSTENVGFIDFDAPSVSFCVKCDAPLAQEAHDSAGIGPEISGYLWTTGSGGIFFDDVVSLERRKFAGHVYNLETTQHVYFAGDILTHNCRCTINMLLKSWQELGLKDPGPGVRASMNGDEPGDISYGKWLRKQPRAFVADTLGPTRAKLFLDGKLPMDRFVDRRGGELTLAELKERESGAWAKAFGT